MSEKTQSFHSSKRHILYIYAVKNHSIGLGKVYCEHTFKVKNLEICGNSKSFCWKRHYQFIALNGINSLYMPSLAVVSVFYYLVKVYCEHSFKVKNLEFYGHGKSFWNFSALVSIRYNPCASHQFAGEVSYECLVGQFW